MPGGDGTGPRGMGPMTGRGMGFCAVPATQGYSNTGSGQGYGRGFGKSRAFGGCGGGRGWRNMFYATGLPGWMRSGTYPAHGYNLDPETEKQALKSQAESLQSQLDLINRRLAGLETKEQTE